MAKERRCKLGRPHSCYYRKKQYKKARYKREHERAVIRFMKQNPDSLYTKCRKAHFVDGKLACVELQEVTA